MPAARIRLGTASPATQATTAQTLSLLAAIAQRAARQAIDILLLPEAFLGGYPRGSSFGCVVGRRSSDGRDEYLRYWNAAVDLGDTVGDGAGAGDAWLQRDSSKNDTPVGDGTREELERIARQTGVFLVVGCIEKAGGSLYCAAVYVCPDQGVVGKRRKVMPTATERLVWAQGSPATLRAVSTTVRGVRVNMAAAICWESYMPLLRQALYAQNVNLYLAPTADDRDAWLSLLRTVGVEGRCFVVSSNMCARRPGAGSGSGVSSGSGVRSGVKARQEDGREGGVHTRNRRSSCLTEEGFEIALPRPSSSSSGTPRAEVELASSNGKARKRRKSVLDEDGNRIVLCCEEEEDEETFTEEHTAIDPEPETAATNGQDETSPTAPSDDESHTLSSHSKRRESVLDADGNEIVLCRKKMAQDDGQVSPKDTRFDGSAPESLTNGHQHTNGVGQQQTGQFVSRGGSAIVSPFGDVLAGPQWEDDQGIIYADVDFDDCIRGRLDLDIAGSYSRNDSFKFAVAGLDMSPLAY